MPLARGVIYIYNVAECNIIYIYIFNIYVYNIHPSPGAECKYNQKHIYIYIC